MSIKTILDGKTFDAFVNDDAKHYENLDYSEAKLLDSLTPTILSIMSKLAPVRQAIIHNLIMKCPDKITYYQTKDIANAIRETVNETSIWCKLLYDMGMLKRRRVEGETGGVKFEYAITNGLFRKWFIMRYTIKK